MKPEKHGRGVEQASQTLDLFVSMGAGSFDVTQTDLDGNQRGFMRSQKLEQLRLGLPQLLESAMRRQWNLIVRPRGDGLVQLDDLDRVALERCKGCAFLVLRTSPDNHQAWLAVPECTEDFARRLRRGSRADPSASGATRLPGSINYKRKYAPEFPMVSILQITPQRLATPVELEVLRLVAPPVVISSTPPARVSRGLRSKRWPSYERCLANAPQAHNANRPDISRADFTFCLIAIDWGWSPAETTARLLEISSKARENGERYAKLTVQRAAAAVLRRGALNQSQTDGTNLK